ncbi:NAD(P)-dependent oxidoreductase [Haladaptatus sp. R4]|uniref:NAD(P)-dependent oxidoreductase n=1 Tax=Haladaptatus sp. R4 TaxID=1679489 RepID=UPI0021017CDF|nr:NAD(P)-dependent oxidoreductase [Haladaptatus sp. R4]
MIPLFHDFRGERVLVFGGGRVGYRKTRRFAREATVVVVGAEFDEEFRAFDEFEEPDEHRKSTSEARAPRSSGRTSRRGMWIRGSKE